MRHLYRTDDVARVLSIIADVSGGVARAADRPKPSPAPESPRDRTVIESVGAITDRTLEAYVRGRAIPLDLARMYLQEVRYRIEERTFRALAFAN